MQIGKFIRILHFLNYEEADIKNVFCQQGYKIWLIIYQKNYGNYRVVL